MKEEGRRVSVRVMQCEKEDQPLLALRKKGAKELKNVGSFQKPEKTRTDASLEPPKRNSTCSHLDFTPVRAISDF